MSLRWAVRFAVEGDPRFFSHHDLMRTFQRAANRASLPLKYSEGFNPRPRMSLASPRPVGVASSCELLVPTLDDDNPQAPWSQRLSAELPRGIEVLAARPLPPGRPLRVVGASYELPLDAGERAAATGRIEALRRRGHWPVRRKVKGALEARTIDIKDGVRRLDLRGEQVTFTIAADVAGASPRPAEVLQLLGLSPDVPSGPDARRHPASSEAMARLTRTALDVDPPDN